MYLLFVDESGTHGGSSAFVLGGIAIHEDDAACMQRAFDLILIDNSTKCGLDLGELEFHAAEIKSPKKNRPKKAASQWRIAP
jgi:hypothetical protein